MEKGSGKGNAAARALCWMLVLAVMLVIFCLSGQNDAQSSELSIVRAERFYRLLFGTVLRPGDPLFTFVHTLVRKTAHVLLYCALSLSVLNALARYPLARGARFGIDLLWCLLYAASDEWHQTFIPGRTGKWTDVLIDGIGVLLGAALFFGICAAVEALRGRKERRAK